MKLSKYSKIILIFGSILTVLAIVSSCVCAILAGRYGDYYVLTNFSKDFLILTRQYAVLTSLGVLIVQMITMKTTDSE